MLNLPFILAVTLSLFVFGCGDQGATSSLNEDTDTELLTQNVSMESVFAEDFGLKVLEASQEHPVLVIMSSHVCGPCQALKKRIANDLHGAITEAGWAQSLTYKVVSVDLGDERSKGLAGYLSADQVPELLIFYKQKVVARSLDHAVPAEMVAAALMKAQSDF